MNKGKAKIYAALAMLAVFALFLANDAKANHIASPICSFLHVGPSNVSSGAATQNQTFKAIIRTDSNQTSASTFIRLTNQNGAALFTNTTGTHRNTSGETAEYEVSYAPKLDAQQTYTVSATYFFLNNSFYNYSITERACANRTFIVDAVSGGFAVIQEQAGAIAEQKKSSTMLFVIAGIVILIIYIVSQTKNKR